MRLPVNCGLSLLSFQIIYCETQLPTDQKLSSSTFLRYMFVCPSRPVTSPLLDHTNHTFLESLWLTHHPTQTHQTHHMAFWVSHSLLCQVYMLMTNIEFYLPANLWSEGWVIRNAVIPSTLNVPGGQIVPNWRQKWPQAGKKFAICLCIHLARTKIRFAYWRYEHRRLELGHSDT